MKIRKDNKRTYGKWLMTKNAEDRERYKGAKRIVKE